MGVKDMAEQTEAKIKGFKVLKIDELTKVSDTNQLVKYYRHQVKTQGGVVFTVDVDEKDFNATKVAEIIGKKAAEADKILAL